jgi:hypothetical protein
MLNKIEDDIKTIYNPEIWEWYYKTYNIPNGKKELKSILLS